MDVYFAAKRQHLARLATGDPREPQWQALYTDYCRIVGGGDDATLRLVALREGEIEERVEAALFLYGQFFSRA